jgi:hypothetical protein
MHADYDPSYLILTQRSGQAVSGARNGHPRGLKSGVVGSGETTVMGQSLDSSSG